MGCASMEKTIYRTLIISFDFCGITNDNPEKILFLKNAPNDSPTEEIASDNELINHDEESVVFEK